MNGDITSTVVPTSSSRPSSTRLGGTGTRRSTAPRGTRRGRESPGAMPFDQPGRCRQPGHAGSEPSRTTGRRGRREARPATSGSPPADVATAPTPTTRSRTARGLVGQRHHGHAAHRVADQHERPVGRDGVDDRDQVVAELVDRGGRRVGAAAGPAVAALVPDDHAVAGAGAGRAAGSARSPRSGVAVAERRSDAAAESSAVAATAARRPRRAARRRRRRRRPLPRGAACPNGSSASGSAAADLAADG